MCPPSRGSKTISARAPSRRWCSGGHQLAMSSVNTANARSIGASTTMDARTDVLSGSLISISFSLFDNCFESGQGGVPEPVEIVAKAGDPVGVQPVDPTVPVLPAGDQAGLLQHLEVLGDRRPGHRKALRQLADGRWAVEELLEDGPPGRVAQRSECIYVS